MENLKEIKKIHLKVFIEILENERKDQFLKLLSIEFLQNLAFLITQEKDGRKVFVFEIPDFQTEQFKIIEVLDLKEYGLDRNVSLKFWEEKNSIFYW